MKRLAVQLLAAMLAAAFLGTDAHASGPPSGEAPAPPPSDGHHGHWHERGFRPRLSLEEFDLNKDGRITHAEIDRVLHTRFDAADTNHDGFLDAAEFAAAHPVFERRLPPPGGGEPRQGHRFQRRLPPDSAEMLKRVDWSLDGKVSFEEFAAPLRQAAMRMDRDGDGVIAGDELRRPEFGPPGPGEPPPPPPRGSDTP